MRRADHIDNPMIPVAMRDQGADTDDGMKDEFWEFIAKFCPDILIAPAVQTICSGKAPQVGHCLDIPNDDVHTHS